MSFDSFSFDTRIKAGINALNFQTPTPIQEKAIPVVLQGSDVMGLAQTGTGKTAAFGLPILQRLLHGPRGVLRALIIAPTRELAEQINSHLTNMGKHTGLRSYAIYGGVGIQPQIQQLQRGVEIIVACPGRLLDHIERRTIRLADVEVLVLDEADRMFDMGFLPDVRRIARNLPRNRQTLMFSATMPADIKRLAHEILREPITVQVGHAAPVETVSHALYPVPQHHKTGLLIKILEALDAGSVLVFTRTKHRAKRLGEMLVRAGFSTASLQGNLSQNRRQEALDGFRSGRYQILVATDIAARGIDVSTISHVINYDMPDTADAYTHRIGRTGRAAKTGDAFTFTTIEDRDMIREIERILGTQLPCLTVENFDYAAPPPPKKANEFKRAPRPQQAARHSRENRWEGRSTAHGSNNAAPRSNFGGGRRKTHGARGGKNVPQFAHQAHGNN
jgi:ATP-dependent RNA helicase RhlE